MSRHRPLFLLRVTLLASLLSLWAGFATAAVMPGEAALPGKSPGAAPRLRLPGSAPAPAVRLAPVADVELEGLRNSNRLVARKRVQIGLARSLAGSEGTIPTARNLRWVATEGGFAARFSATSPGAAAMRLAIDLASTPADAQMVFFGSASPERLLGPVRAGDIAHRSAPWWTPVTLGETQTVEVFLPRGYDPAAAGLDLRQASHLVIAPSGNLPKALAKIGQSESCNIDSNCVTNPSQAYLNARNAVARMSFILDGSSYLCTGTLLNDANPVTQIPWFYSANHCFDDESFSRTTSEKQAIAATLNTFWFYESAACGSTTLSSAMVQRIGGADFLKSDGPTDFMLLRLNDAAPAGAYFAAWDSATIPAGLELIAIHHPQGDLKKYSVGTGRCHGRPSSEYTSGAFIEMHWSKGTTEPGSSGSGIFNFSDGEYYFRGGLQGGYASCSTPASPDFYSRFDLAYAYVSEWLNPFSASQVGPSIACTPSANYTDIWWNSSQSGWGLNLIQHTSNNIFGAWYTYGYGGNPRWIVMPGGTWYSSVEFSGTLYATTGPPYTAAFDPALVNVFNVGTGTLTFTGTGSGLWSYTVEGNAGSKAITRTPY